MKPTFLRLLGVSFLSVFLLTACSKEEAVKEDLTESVEDTTTYELIVTIIPEEGGSVVRSDEGPDYKKGDTVLVQAVAEDGYEFVKWEGDIVSIEDSITIIMDTTYVFTAIFEEEEKPLFYLADNGVTIKCPLAKVGDTGTVNGILYTKRKVEDITPANASTTCTCGITDMNSLFKNEFNFNGDISSWDVSSVENMEDMFYRATSFNQDIGSWDVSSVTNMDGMFAWTVSFNQDIGSWDVSNVANMSGLFAFADSFDQPIGYWDVSNVTDMSGMFSGAESFNQALNE